MMKEEEETLSPAFPDNTTSTPSIITSYKIAENDEKSSLLNGHAEETIENTSQQNGKIVSNEANEVKCQREKMAEKEESYFKTPALPSNNNKTRSLVNKRRPKMSSDLANKKISDSEPTTDNNAFEFNSKSVAQYREEALLREFVSIGKHSFICSRSQQYIAKKYPGLVLSKNNRDGNEEDLIKEIVVDEFSLLLFHSMDDYNLLRECEEKIKEQEKVLTRQKQYEENLRLGKIKKKGRKSKLELKRTKKEAKRKARKEQKENRRLEREERRQRKLIQSEGQHQQGAATSSSQQQDDQQRQQQQELRKERREHKEANKLEREKRREEKKRQKTRKIEEERHREKHAPKTAIIIDTTISTPSVIPNPSCLSANGSVPSTSRSSLITQQQQTTTTESGSNAMKIKIEKLDAENQAPPETHHKQQKLESSIGVKRPSSTAIGIAAVHRNGLIQSPTNNNFMSNMPPASKTAKLEPTHEEYGQQANSRGLLIGIALSTASSGQQQHTNSAPLDVISVIENKDAIKNTLEKDLFKTVYGGSLSSSLAGSSTQSSLLHQQDQLQQVLLKNPELAYSFQQSLATLYSIDPSLVARATSAGLIPGYGGESSSIKPTSSIIQSHKPSNDPRIGPQNLLPTFPLGVPLASQLATLAASQSGKHSGSNQQNQSIPFKSGRWCNMHAVIAHEIAKHQDTAKKAEGRKQSTSSGADNVGYGGGRQSTSSNNSGRATASDKKGPSATTSTPVIAAQSHQKNVANSAGVVNNTQLLSHSAGPASTPSAAAQLLQLQQLQEQQQLRNKTGSSNILSTSSTPVAPTSTSTTSLQQQLSLLLAQQQQGGQGQQQQQAQLAAALNESLFTSNLVARLQNTLKAEDISLLSSTANNLLGLSSISQQFLPSSSSLCSSSSSNNHMFGGFPIQPLGQGIGSLTSGNSDAAAAAQLQQQSQLLATLQQQQAQLAASYQQQPATSSSSSLLAANLLAQFGSANPGLNASSSSSSSNSFLQQQQNLLSGLLNSSASLNSGQFALSQPAQRQQIGSLSGGGSLLQQQVGAGTSSTALGHSSSSFSSSLDHNQHHSLPNSNSILSSDAGAESILAAFLNGQSMEPKVAFPPHQFPPLPSSSSSAAVNTLSSPTMNIEQQLMRQQLAAAGQLHSKLPKLSTGVSAAGTFPPPPSSLIGASLLPGAPTPMNPIEQELLMRQLRIVQQQQQIANNSLGAVNGGQANAGAGTRQI